MSSFLTYDEIVRALRKAEQFGDCMPEESIERTARKLVLFQRKRVHPKPFHVIIRTKSGAVVDPNAELFSEPSADFPKGRR